MTITIRNYITGEAIKTWNQPGKRADALAIGMEYAVGTHFVDEGKSSLDIWVVVE